MITRFDKYFLLLQISIYRDIILFRYNKNSKYEKIYFYTDECQN